MKKVLFCLVAFLILNYAGVSFALAEEAAKTGAPAAAAEKPKAAAGKLETLSGTLQMVVADKKLVVVQSSKGISYNFKVTAATRIKVSGNKAKLADLSAATSKSVTVKFRAEKQAGNLAQSIEVQ